MPTSIRNNISHTMAFGWEAIAEWGMGVIVIAGGVIIWLAKIIRNLLLENWHKRRKSTDDRLDLLELKFGKIEDVIYFTDLEMGKKTNIQRYMIHKFANQQSVLNAIDEHVDNLGKSHIEILGHLKKIEDRIEI